MMDKMQLQGYAAIDLACQLLAGFGEVEQNAWREANKARDILMKEMSEKEIKRAEKFSLAMLFAIERTQQ